MFKISALTSNDRKAAMFLRSGIDVAQAPEGLQLQDEILAADSHHVATVKAIEARRALVAFSPNDSILNHGLLMEDMSLSIAGLTIPKKPMNGAQAYEPWEHLRNRHRFSFHAPQQDQSEARDRIPFGTEIKHFFNSLLEHPEILDEHRGNMALWESSVSISIDPSRLLIPGCVNESASASGGKAPLRAFTLTLTGQTKARLNNTLSQGGYHFEKILKVPSWRAEPGQKFLFDHMDTLGDLSPEEILSFNPRTKVMALLNDAFLPTLAELAQELRAHPMPIWSVADLFHHTLEAVKRDSAWHADIRGDVFLENEVPVPWDGPRQQEGERAHPALLAVAGNDSAPSRVRGLRGR